jgi:hypothetical protein
MQAANVLTSYLVALPPVSASVEPNHWAIVLRIGAESTVIIELRQADPMGCTLTVCGDGPRILSAGELKGVAKSWPLEVRKGSTVGEWLGKLVSSGATRYQLVNGVGKLFYHYYREL